VQIRLAVVLLIAALLLSSCGVFLCASDVETMDRVLERDRAAIELINGYLIGVEGHHVFTAYHMDRDSESGAIRINVAPGEQVAVSEEEVNVAFRQLFSQGYMDMGREGGAIRFTRCGTLVETRGMVYFPGGYLPENTRLLSFIVTLEPMSEEGWYYWVSNFRLWREDPCGGASRPSHNLGIGESCPIYMGWD